MKSKSHNHHDTTRCAACDGDGELTASGLTVGELAWCTACRGTGLVDNACDGCGEAVTLDTKHDDAWGDARILVHAGCETSAAFFDRVA